MLRDNLINGLKKKINACSFTAKLENKLLTNIHFENIKINTQSKVSKILCNLNQNQKCALLWEFGKNKPPQKKKKYNSGYFTSLCFDGSHIWGFHNNIATKMNLITLKQISQVFIDHDIINSYYDGFNIYVTSETKISKIEEYTDRVSSICEMKSFKKIHQIVCQPSFIWLAVETYDEIMKIIKIDLCGNVVLVIDPDIKINPYKKIKVDSLCYDGENIWFSDNRLVSTKDGINFHQDHKGQLDGGQGLTKLNLDGQIISQIPIGYCSNMCYSDGFIYITSIYYIFVESFMGSKSYDICYKPQLYKINQKTNKVIHAITFDVPQELIHNASHEFVWKMNVCSNGKHVFIWMVSEKK